MIFGYEHLHPVVASPLLDVSSTGNLAADSPLDHHLNASMPLTEGPGIAVSVGYFVPLLVTSGGNTYILLFTDRFSRRARMFAVTAAEFTAEGTTNIIIDRYIPLWGCPRSVLSGNGLQFRSKLTHAVYKLLEVRKIATSSYHPNDIGGVERLNHKMAHMLAMVVDEFQNNCEEQLSLTSNLRTQVWSTLPPV